ncbi:helix-turn-helix domain-containing protein [Methylobacterium marchantiae]|uniref:Helix-turn-helix domain-containing protein n=1 Tax=Methylobacterium marchantiae TaxID=600331 RepID=A0ABW3X548_9HYPH|nr:hypothetical protein AIGOOFII_4296 [Methylobacterium marchantiae]
MPQHDISVLKQRVQARLDDLGMTVAEATRRGKLPKDFIYDLLNDRKKSVRSDNIYKLALALDCDHGYLEGQQNYISIVDNIVDFDRPPVYIIGEAAVGVYVDKSSGSKYQRFAPDMPTLPPDTRFPAEGQVDLFIRGNSINRFAPSGYILRCVLIDHWPELIRPGDLIVVDRFKGDLRERAAWRIFGNEKYIEYRTDSDIRSETQAWRTPVKSEKVTPLGEDAIASVEDMSTDEHKPFAVVIFAYAEPRIRRMF